MKIGVIGNTNLTFKAILLLLEKKHDIRYVFGLSKKKLVKKANAYEEMDQFCLKNNINYIISDDWNDIINIDVDIVFEMGDSRIVPSLFLEKHKVIGNHGAILPNVQGAASLTWGRMLNNGHWGVSLFELNEKIDNGDILVTKDVFYDPKNTKMDVFVEMCDNRTVECIKKYLNGDFMVKQNKKWDIKLNHRIDSEIGVSILLDALEKKLNIYMPPRNEADSKLKNKWDESFKRNFRLANNKPYPIWSEEQ